MKNHKEAKKVLERLMGEKFSFAMLLRSIRAREGLTQRELADILKVTVSHISDIETGRKFVSVVRACDFAHKLHESERFFVAISLQDQLNLADLDYKVEIA
ncbi:MAG: helix-turn-helix domain-containing protein [Bacteriovoracaceae bacterium]|nr:helix-turn-helix domain-containing protein [Bacteriovoracaceae bacterium]